MAKYWLWLTTRRFIGSQAVRKLLRHFGTPEAIYAADPDTLRCLNLLSSRELEALADHSMDLPEKILADCYEQNISILTLQDAQYPERLRNIYDPPAVLYYRGRLPNFDTEPAVAVVGTRNCTPYGILMARQLGYQMANDGALVVSGLAAGIDRYAMEGALSAERPVTGVLGGGVDVVYPSGNRLLYEDVAVRGCLLSEYPPGTQPLSAHFPVRNRIIAGLTLGCLVVEAPEDSGALITARLALEQGRDVFAVPGNVGSVKSRGCNRLLKEGAILVENGWDVMQEYEAAFPGVVRNRSGGERLTLSRKEYKTASQNAVQQAEARTAPEEKTEAAPSAEVSAETADPPVQDSQVYLDLQAMQSTRSRDQLRILQALAGGPVHADDIVERTQLRTATVNAALSLLEVDGLVEKLPGRHYKLTIPVRPDQPD